MSEKNSNNTLAFLLGIVVGALLGVLFAPAGGKETRKKIAKYLEELEEKGEEFIGEGTEKVKKFIAESKDKVVKKFEEQ
jgi:gas vesicle protein